MKKAVILLSGGLDSATVLALAKQTHEECYALSFNYGQKHIAETNSAINIAQSLGATAHEFIDINMGKFGGSSLTDKQIVVPDHKQHNDIPSTYVPARNTIFLSIALGWAETLGAHDIYFGANAVDYSGYPDCRPHYIEAFETMANLATKQGAKPFRIHAPLLYLTKAEIIRLGTEHGIDYRLTVSCYRADDRGNACGQCDSCYYRREGFLEAKLADTTRYKHYHPSPP